MIAAEANSSIIFCTVLLEPPVLSESALETSKMQYTCAASHMCTQLARHVPRVTHSLGGDVLTSTPGDTHPNIAPDHAYFSSYGLYLSPWANDRWG